LACILVKNFEVSIPKFRNNTFGWCLLQADVGLTCLDQYVKRWDMRIVKFVILFCLFALSAFAANTEKNFGGVGIDGAAMPDGQIKVRQVVAGGPAHLAGVHVGDVITHIDSKATRGSNFQQMVHKRLRGAAGTPVVIKIHRQGSDKPLSFTLVRRQMIVGSGR